MRLRRCWWPLHLRSAATSTYTTESSSWHVPQPPRSNDTHESTSDPDARLYRKGNTASELRYIGHTLSDNRHGLIANARGTRADGDAGREAAQVMSARAQPAAPRKAEERRGWGRGLALAGRVVEAYHAGGIGIRHSAPGQGTVMVIRFPT